MTYSNGIPLQRGSAGPARPPRPDDLSVGLVMQGVLLVALSAGAGLGAAGWAAGATFGLATWALLMAGLQRTGRSGLGPADRVTLARTALVGGVTALAVESLTRPVPATGVVALTVTALLLDGVDGQVARRTGTSSGFGARFDMEVDAFLILVLGLLLVRPLGGWVLALGGMRYAFVVAGWALPWLRAALPQRFSRKVVAAVQGVVLVVAVAGVLPAGVTLAAVLVALASLCWSFGRDVVWLARRRAVPTVGAACAAEAPGYVRSEPATPREPVTT